MFAMKMYLTIFALFVLASSQAKLAMLEEPCEEHHTNGNFHLRKLLEPCASGFTPAPPPPPTPSPAVLAATRQKAAAVAKAVEMYDKTDGVVLVPGPRGTLGHKKRCPVASQELVNELADDESDKLWGKTKKLIDAAVKLLLDENSTEGIQIVRDIEAECLALGSDVAKIQFINSLGGDKIDDFFKSTCDISDHLDGIVEDQASNLVKKLVFDTHAGEYLAMVLSGASSRDFCGLVCRKNKSGVALKTCIYGCAETLEPNCWSQCDLYTCKRGCKNAFWHRRKKRHSCYARCESKCSYN